MKDNCCSLYNQKFDDRVARKDLATYLDKGVSKSTNLILRNLNNRTEKGDTLLDIGGGIGVITFELIKQGIAHVHHVDLSQAYLRTYTSEFQRRDLTEQITTYEGDFVDRAKELPKADIVTLDKVICCYREFEDLVQLSAGKARKYYSFTIPTDHILARLMRWLVHPIILLTNNNFRAHVHSHARIGEILRDAGFRYVEDRRYRWWKSYLYMRI